MAGLFNKIKKIGANIQPQDEVKKETEEVKKVSEKPGEKATPKPKSQTKEPKKAGEKEVSSKERKTDTKDAYRVLVKPLVTEKSTFLGQYNQYVFEVAPHSNKIEIKKAVKNVYGVTPIKVRVVNVLGKDVTYGRSRGTKKAWRKAVVTLRPGDKITVYEGT